MSKGTEGLWRPYEHAKPTLLLDELMRTQIEELRSKIPQNPSRISKKSYVLIFKTFFDNVYSESGDPLTWVVKNLRKANLQRSDAFHQGSTGEFHWLHPKTRVVLQLIEFADIALGLSLTQKALNKIIPKLSDDDWRFIGPWSIVFLFSRKGTREESLVKRMYEKTYHSNRTGALEWEKSNVKEPWQLGLGSPTQRFQVDDIQEETPMDQLSENEQIKKAIRMNQTVIEKELKYTGSLESLRKKILNTVGVTPRAKFEEVMRQLEMEQRIKQLQ